MMINLSERHSTADKQNLMQPPPGIGKTCEGTQEEDSSTQAL